MNHDPDKPSGRKVKFAPSRKPRVTAATPKPDSKAEVSDAQAQQLMRQFNEKNTRPRPKVEKKSAHVAFGAPESSSSSIRTFGARREVSCRPETDSEMKDPNSVEMKTVSFASSSATDNETAPSSSNVSAQKIKEGYKEPWNYGYYPITHPWRKPFSGDPEVLDREEFGEATQNMEYDERTINSALDLGLLEESDKPKYLLFKLPERLPLNRKSAVDLSELPGGTMGKLLVYKSGATKLKLGDILFDVSPGTELSSDRDLVVIDTEEKTFSVVGEIDKLAVVTPDIDSILKP